MKLWLLLADSKGETDKKNTFPRRRHGIEPRTNGLTIQKSKKRKRLRVALQDNELVQNILGKASSKAMQFGGKARDITQFIRASPILTGTAITGTALGGGLVIAQQIRKRRKPKKVKRRKTTTKGKRKRKKSRRGIIRGRGLGRSEIKHTRKGTKLVSFRTKGGKLVRFKVKGTSTRRRGFVKKRKKRR